MRVQKFSRTLMVLLVLLSFSYALPSCFSEGHTLTYNLLDRPGGTKQYRLSVFVPQSLYEYYAGQGHMQFSEADFAKFVTPQALKPIADKLWEIYRDYENFANGVLMIVHQIPYAATEPAKYPVETIVENKGDCDLLSYVAASILKAGGLEVVLLYYRDKAHMNVGVSLPSRPRYARTGAYYVIYRGAEYYIAECTGGNWSTGWRVGECPPALIGEAPIVVTLENCEKQSPGQVSASYTTLKASTLSLTSSSTFIIQGSAITLSGQLMPKLPNEKITVYVRIGGSQWVAANSTTTGYNGEFTCTIKLDEAGICYIRASWSGNDDYAGADSPIVTVTVLPLCLIAFLIMVPLVCAVAVIFLASRKGCREELPEIPSIQVSFQESLC